MKQFLILFFFVFSHSCFSNAQSRTIRGIVKSSETGLPLTGCSVFINNTSRGTASDQKGRFELNNIPQGKYELVVSSIGYEASVNVFGDKDLPLELNISLRVKPTELPDITVEPFLENGWEQWGIFFVSNFIGTSSNAFYCRIINKKAIHFRYSQKNKLLRAFADEPLLIENEAMGYSVRFELEEFSYDENKDIVTCFGYSLFDEKQTSNQKTRKRWNKNRETAYHGSIMHFMRSLYSDHLAKENFDIKKITSSRDTVSISASDLLHTDQEDKKNLFFSGKVLIRYSNTGEKRIEQSTINLLTPSPVFVEANGNYYPPKEIYTGGYWSASEKMVNMLPFDYIPSNENQTNTINEK